MTYQAIRDAQREGKLSGYSLSELRQMRLVCIYWLQSQNKDDSGVKDSVEDEINRKEESEARSQEESTARQMHGEALAESRYATKYAFWSFLVALLASAIGIGAWMFPRAPHESHLPDVQAQPSVLFSPTNLTTNTVDQPQIGDRK